MKFYIASGLENWENVRKLKGVLCDAGHEHTYDWTVHGSVQREGVERIGNVAAFEVEGVIAADVVIVLLPGGRGTHTELGIAIAMKRVWDGNRRILVYSPDPEKDFGTGGTTCAFYHHKFVEKFDDMNALILNLMKERP